ncbi:MAG: hypothetical protein KDH19_04190 [Geminicoccaceae bacterium]|nr:hypothetical protein [Geminicoccaceae bacterium]
MERDKTQTGRKPEDTLRDGALKVSIWKNEGEKGPFFSATIAKTYRDDQGKYQDGHSLSSNDLLRVSELSRRAHNRIIELKRDQAHEPQKDMERTSDRERSR